MLRTSREQAEEHAAEKDYAEVVEIHGMLKLSEARNRLCHACRYWKPDVVACKSYWLLPLTRKGEDCPYYATR